MSEFTKEELKLLSGCVFSKFVNSLEDPSIEHLQGDLKSLYHKLNDMVDCYKPCEHVGVPCELVDEGGTLKMQQCSKCGVFFK